MEYKLYKNGHNDVSNVLKEVLQNRGIEDYESYLEMLEDPIFYEYESQSYDCLDNIEKAADCLLAHIQYNDVIGILVDSDPDGYCSAAMMYLYIKNIYPEYPILYILHSKTKSHGLTSGDINFPDNMRLLIIPDAGTNDTCECEKLFKNGIDVIILDHHEKDEKKPENKFAIIVNNQISERYLNKNFCGAGVVYRFLQCLDDKYWIEHADDYLDLVAFANISDVMDMRSFETRYYVELGLKAITNRCLRTFIQSQNYSMNDKITVHNVQWYITPLWNALIRIGSVEERELLFKALIGSNETFEYKKRATKDNPTEVIQENIYDRAVRLCKNIKSRQDKMREKYTERICNDIGEITDNDKVIVYDATDIIEGGLTGVTAIKIAELYHRPCIILREQKNIGMYGGSARNFKHSPVEKFKNIVNQTKMCSGLGHKSAFGVVELPVYAKDEFKKRLNNILKNVVYTSVFYVDYIFDVNAFPLNIIYELSQFDNIIGEGIEEPMIAVENIELNTDEIIVFGKNEDVMSFTLNGIRYIQFKCKAGNELYDAVQDGWSVPYYVRFNIVGKPCINEYQGVKTPQIVIEGINVIDYTFTV